MRPTPLLLSARELTGSSAGNAPPSEHESHEWIDEYKIDIDHGKQWTDVIVPRLQARRHTSKQEEIVPRRYEFVYYRASQLNQMKRK